MFLENLGTWISLSCNYEEFNLLFAIERTALRFDYMMRSYELLPLTKMLHMVLICYVADVWFILQFEILLYCLTRYCEVVSYGDCDNCSQAIVSLCFDSYWKTHEHVHG
jgi:hypothetical protein